MKALGKQLLSEAERQKIEACVAAAETRTRGEIVVMVAPESNHYPAAALRGAAALALPVSAAFTPVLGGVFWAGPSNLWVFLELLIPLFIGFNETLMRIPGLKRWFIRSSEMEDEVREAAQVQFFTRGLHRTAGETGVLFYVSVFEHRVWVIGDRGVNARVPDSYWKDVAGGIAQAIRAGRTAEGICRAVTQVADVLEEKFPLHGVDTDELKNLIVEGGSG
jgi:putative membrane protein